jgi:molybdopterin-guanine dinucleotide biosynthesis protein A
MAILGAILAGGQSRRFGSDKALAIVDGVPMLTRVQAALAAQVDALVVCGGTRANVDALPDRPAPGIGPLGGLNAALHHARVRGLDAVLSVPVDTFPLPHDLVDRLGQGPAAFANQYLIGIWPTALQPDLDELIKSGARAVQAWLEASRCKLVQENGLMLRNINSPADRPST